VTRRYPVDLAERVRANWPAEARALPDALDAVLDAAYHASFLQDEERPVACRVLVIPPEELPIDDGPPAALLPLAFATRRRFDEQELRRVSPAASMQRALVGVDDSRGELETWGIIQSGPRWLQVAQGGRATEPPMPAALLVRIVRPGHVVVSCGSRPIAELRGGKLVDYTLDVFQSDWLAGTFASSRESLVAEHVAKCAHPLDAHVATALSRYVGQQMIKRVVATMRAAHHGGLLVIGPPDCIGEQFLNTKYALFDAAPRRRYRTIVLRILDTLAERAAATGRPPDPDLYRADLDPRLAELDEALFETSHLIAALASVDGAVVLTKRFEILGFGAEIAGGLPTVTAVRRALDLEGDTFTTEVVDVVGTRHRSAYRFCAAVPGSLALVVSQDGGVRFVTMHRDHVTWWEHGPGDF
jgi:Probable sensor domain DACNV